MKFSFTMEARCSDLPLLPVHWWITIVVVIFLVPTYGWGELIALLNR